MVSIQLNSRSLSLTKGSSGLRHCVPGHIVGGISSHCCCFFLFFFLFFSFYFFSLNRKFSMVRVRISGYCCCVNGINLPTCSYETRLFFFNPWLGIFSIDFFFPVFNYLRGPRTKWSNSLLFIAWLVCLIHVLMVKYLK